MKNVDYYNFILLYIKISKTAYYARNRDVILNRVKKYYENKKQVLREHAKKKSMTTWRGKKYKDKVWEKHISKHVWRKKLKI